MHAAPMYIAETAPSQIRGQLISLKEFFIVLGMVVSIPALKEKVQYLHKQFQLHCICYVYQIMTFAFKGIL